MTTKLFGAKVPRVEDQRFLRGQGRYVDDLLHDDPRLLHSAVLRSPHAHARITDIDVSDVLDVEGVLAVWTYDDLAGAMAEPLPLLIPHPTCVPVSPQSCRSASESSRRAGTCTSWTEPLTCSRTSWSSSGWLLMRSSPVRSSDGRGGWRPPGSAASAP